MSADRLSIWQAMAKYHRRDEPEWRRLGKFDTADICRNAADAFERTATGCANEAESFDRGRPEAVALLLAAAYTTPRRHLCGECPRQFPEDNFVVHHEPSGKAVA